MAATLPRTAASPTHRKLQSNTVAYAAVSSCRTNSKNTVTTPTTTTTTTTSALPHAPATLPFRAQELEELRWAPYDAEMRVLQGQARQEVDEDDPFRYPGGDRLRNA